MHKSLIQFLLGYGREDFEHLYKKNSCPDYNKNYDLILKKTILMVPDLKETTPRNFKVKLFLRRILNLIVLMRTFLIMVNTHKDKIVKV